MEFFRFDKPRAYQDKAIEDIYDAISSGKSILMSAPTGIGKTDAAISAALRCAMEKGLDIIFLTPKISQHRIVVESLNGVNQKFGLGIKFIDMVGKRNLCTNPDVNMLESEAFYKTCEKLTKSGKCPFFSNFQNIKENMPESVTSASSYGHNELFKKCFESGICAYEATAELSKSAKVVIADYAHVLNPSISKRFLRKIEHKLENSIVIWDEAHNIIEHASRYLSSSISSFGINAASKELAQVGSKIDLGYLQFSLGKLAERKLNNAKESFLQKDDLAEITNNAEAAIKQLEEAGIEYIEKTKAKRSYLLHIARFIESWISSDESFARIISKSNKAIKVSLVSLYPESAPQIFEEAYANVFMSATLTPLRMYQQFFGISNSVIKQYGTPFPSSNRLVCIDDSVTTKYKSRSIEEYKRIAERISKVKSAIPGRIAVFFPSFEVLNSTLRYMKGVEVHIQHPSMSSAEIETLLSSFKKSSDSMLFGVLGGSLSEGVDYPKNMLKGVIIVGVPLPKPDLEITAKINYYDKKFGGKGVEYAYVTPAVIKGIQAAGRAIRSEKDKATIIFMDKRYRWSTYYPSMQGLIASGSDYISKIREFWSVDQSTSYSIDKPK
ncbi:MAG: ATP-dependent DNA helicase [Candidatus Micrarchaeia archaeon]